MKITMKATISGTRDGVDWPKPGESLDVPDAEAVDLLSAGLAVPAPAPEPEKAVERRPVEKRTPRTRKG